MTRNVYDAVSIEHTMDIFFGTPIGGRGKAWDANIWRRGDPKKIAAVIHKVADHAEKRVAQLSWTAQEQENGGSQKRINSGISGLRSYADGIESGAVQPDDSRWELLGSLVMMIDSLLSHQGV